ncbi:MAG: hypothetical protein ABI871_06755 [Chthoniobacterales bacterium]
MLTTLPCLAGARRFTYIYEATTSPPGGFESENWVTWKTDKPNDHAFDQVDFRHEIEFGITDHFQLAVYLADWFYEDGHSVENEGFAYADSALELIYNLSSPAADLLGVAIYGEIKAGYRTFELESKLIAQKDIGPLVLAYNATLEATWEGEDLEEKDGEIQQSLGASYEITPHLLAGVELLHEIAIPEWREAERGFFFAGPNVSVRGGKWWATATALAQLTRAGDEPNFQLRTIVGYEF